MYEVILMADKHAKDTNLHDVAPSNVKGVILAGGTGSRLSPLTKATNKHLLPVYNKPMIYYPIMTLLNAGIKEIMIVTGGENVGDFLKLLGSGREFGAKFTYGCQDGSGGIPVALFVAKDFVDDKFVVILGDNVMEDNIRPYVEKFSRNRTNGAHVFLQKVNDPSRFGVAEIRNGKIVRAVEKPEERISDLTIIGVYMFDKSVFDVIPSIQPSARGELEIVDVLNYYIKNGNITHDILDGFWIDAGNFDALYEANRFMAQREIKNRTKKPKGI